MRVGSNYSEESSFRGLLTRSERQIAAQIFNLPYRRISICLAWWNSSRCDEWRRVQRRKGFLHTERSVRVVPPLHAAGLSQRDNRYR